MCYVKTFAAGSTFTLRKQLGAFFHSAGDHLKSFGNNCHCWFPIASEGTDAEIFLCKISDRTAVII